MPSCPQITRPSQVLLGWGIYRNAPRNVPSPSPQQLLAQCRWPAAPQPAPGPAGTCPPGCWQSCPPFLLPPCSQCPMPTVGPGWGRVTQCRGASQAGPGPSVLQREPKTLFSSRRLKGQHMGLAGTERGRELGTTWRAAAAGSASRGGGPVALRPQTLACPHSPCPRICSGTRVPIIPESPSAHSLRGSGVGLLPAL